MINVLSSHREAEPVSFIERLAGSDAFRAMFREGMTLVEEAAAYLDGPGRNDSKALARVDALSYASESMRLTTRLMQLASWLLLQRAVNEGEMSAQQAASDKHKVNLSMQEVAAAPDAFQRLPARLRDLVMQSMRLQARVMHLDQLLYGGKASETPHEARSPVADQLAKLQAALQANRL